MSSVSVNCEGFSVYEDREIESAIETVLNRLEKLAERAAELERERDKLADRISELEKELAEAHEARP